MNERELFDQWYGVKPKGWFEAVRYNTAWKAWQASANREGYKLVPVDKLNRIISDTTDIDTYEDLKAMMGVVE